MNTIATAATAVSAHSSFFATKEDYLAFQAHWKVLANARALTADDAALRILVLGQDPLRSMPPTKNPLRVANGAWYGSGLKLSMDALAHRARAAQRYLDKLAAGTPIPLAPFVETWSKHGISVEAFATLYTLSSEALAKAVA